MRTKKTHTKRILRLLAHLPTSSDILHRHPLPFLSSEISSISLAHHDGQTSALVRRRQWHVLCSPKIMTSGTTLQVSERQKKKKKGLEAFRNLLMTAVDISGLKPSLWQTCSCSSRDIHEYQFNRFA